MDFPSDKFPFGHGSKPPERSFFDDRAMKMMEKIGYREGMDLKMSSKHERRSVGFLKPTHQLLENTNWDISSEVIHVKQEVVFISSDLDASDMDLEDIKLWAEFTPKPENYPIDPKYCDPILQEEVLSGKEALGNIEGDGLRSTRRRANPFETINNAIFLNRAALKMANIDAACGFMFTNIEKDVNHRTTNTPIYFADVCAGPGGFSEYILWKKKWFYKGFGFTLLNKHNFQLDSFWAASPATFQSLYGAKNDGNIYDPENIDDFREKVFLQTNNKGVHFMMSDGGFNVDGYEHLQEVLSKKIYLCQCLVGLSIVREKGHFMTKMFDTFTSFTIGLIYLMYRCFDEIGILKPNASRPANSERYFICKSRRKNIEHIREYLMYINRKLWEDGDVDIMKIVPEDVINSDDQFMKYIVNVNHSICERQISSLKKLMQYYNDSSLREPRQTDLRLQCLKFWQIPNEMRTQPEDIIPGDYISKLLKNPDVLLSLAGHVKTKNNLSTYMKDINDWNICLLENGVKPQYKFYIACGGKRLYELNQNNWQLSLINLELPRGSLVLAEHVKETACQVSKTTYSCFHIIDAFQLGDLNISSYSLPKRRDLIEIFCEATSKLYKSYRVNVRIKPMFNLSTNFNNLQAPTQIASKKGKDMLIYELPLYLNESLSFSPGFVLFIKNGDFLSTYPERFYCELAVTSTDLGESISWSELNAFVQNQNDLLL